MSWGPDPVSPGLLGDSGPWIWELPTLIQALNDPRGPWLPPAAPWRPGGRSNELAAAIAFWAPLTTLTYGVLGWVQPDVGIQRWLAAGRPTDTAELMVLDRWWGEHALALTAWAQTSPSPAHYSHEITERTASVVTAPAETEPVRAMPEWHRMLDGGTDPLHLGHVLDHLLGPGLTEGGLTGHLLNDPPTGGPREASLVMDTYSGWYSRLTQLGKELPHRPDGRSWRVHVTVKPLGYLGTYRRSRDTGRWFAGRHAHHLLGWPG
jgi:hypothetical protein